MLTITARFDDFEHQVLEAQSEAKLPSVPERWRLPKARATYLYERL